MAPGLASSSMLRSRCRASVPARRYSRSRCTTPCATILSIFWCAVPGTIPAMQAAWRNARRWFARAWTPTPLSTLLQTMEIYAMNRSEITELIVLARLKQKLTWADLARIVGRSKEWTTAALLGQMTLTEAQARAVGDALELPEEAVAGLQVVPYKGSLPTAVPTDPLIYRFYELINVYGTTFKELIHEEHGDGIMSAIDFRMDLQREPDPAGDRVRIVMSGKFLPYKSF